MRGVFHVKGVWEGDVCNFVTSILTILLAGALVQFTMGNVRCLIVCILIRPPMVGAVGLRLMKFQVMYYGLAAVNGLAKGFIYIYYSSVGFLSVTSYLLLEMKCSILVR
jgi:hypothetical protein